VEQLIGSLTESGVHAALHPWLPGCLTVSATGDLERLPAFQKGWFYVQDPAARLAVLAAGPEPGWSVLDACAAPGGKSFAAAIAMGDRGRVISCDIHPHKKKLLQAGAERLGLSILQAETQDSTQRRPEWAGAFDLVIADVPCSGLGVIRKKPDIRYKDPAPLAGLPRVQRDILNAVSDCVKPGGILLYSTCTLLERENEAVATGFLAEHPEFVLEPFALPGPAGQTEGQLTLWPHRHGTDGFFIARLRRHL
jgi:16S rRNA (cytosine967-C5)-methyltransferase